MNLRCLSAIGLFLMGFAVGAFLEHNYCPDKVRYGASSITNIGQTNK